MDRILEKERVIEGLMEEVEKLREEVLKEKGKGVVGYEGTGDEIRRLNMEIKKLSEENSGLKLDHESVDARMSV